MIEVPPQYRPPFQDAEGNRCVEVDVQGLHDIFFKHGETKVSTTAEALRAFADWHENLSMKRVSTDWDGGYFDATAEIKSISICEFFDTEHDYPDTNWPDPKFIKLSTSGAYALMVWVRLTFPKD